MNRIALIVLFLACSSAAHAQSATSWVSSQWTPMTEENARSYQQADADFKTSVEADYQRRLKEAQESSSKRRDRPEATQDDSGVLVPGGVENPLVPRGKGKLPQPPTVTSLRQMLPESLEFAAPTSGGLIVQRMSSSVLFGRPGSQDLIMIPLNGETDLPHGMRGSIREEGKQLRLMVSLPAGQVVEFRYQDDPDSPGRVMSVDVSVLGALPGKNVDFKRRYARAQGTPAPVR